MVRFGADAGLPVPPGPGPMAVSCRPACPATAPALQRAGLVRGLPGRCAPYARAPDPPCADAAALHEVSACGFAWREDLERLVSRDRPAKIPAPGRCPSWPWPPGPGQSRAFARLVSDPRRRRALRTAAGAGGAATGCARRRLRRAGALPMPCVVCCAGQPCGFTGCARGRCEARAVRVSSINPVRPAAPVAGAVVSGLRP